VYEDGPVVRPSVDMGLGVKNGNVRKAVLYILSMKKAGSYIDGN